jgi:hypothetical protein
MPTACRADISVRRYTIGGARACAVFADIFTYHDPRGPDELSTELKLCIGKDVWRAVFFLSEFVMHTCHQMFRSCKCSLP